MPKSTGSRPAEQSSESTGDGRPTWSALVIPCEAHSIASENIGDALKPLILSSSEIASKDSGDA
eukprot:9128950-Karenia_brevis.AAC.1